MNHSQPPAQALSDPPIRPEYANELEPFTELVVAKKISLWQRLWQQSWLRKTGILLVLAVVWQIIGQITNNDLLLPTFSQTASAFWQGLISGELLVRAGVSLNVLVKGYFLGVIAAFLLTSLAVSSQLGRDLLSTLTSMFNPLPAIALLPLALLWFGLGEKSLIFVLIHSVLWPLALSTYTGFLAVPDTLRMAGRNYGLRASRYILTILVPAALPSILSGLRLSWAFAWRTLIAAELVFGTTSGQGGLGWYIFQNRNELYTDRVFAGLALVIILGLLVENVFFNTLERFTVKKWGLQR